MAFGDFGGLFTVFVEAPFVPRRFQMPANEDLLLALHMVVGKSPHDATKHILLDNVHDHLTGGGKHIHSHAELREVSRHERHFPGIRVRHVQGVPNVDAAVPADGETTTHGIRLQRAHHPEVAETERAVVLIAQLMTTDAKTPGHQGREFIAMRKRFVAMAKKNNTIESKKCSKKLKKK